MRRLNSFLFVAFFSLPLTAVQADDHTFRKPAILLETAQTNKLAAHCFGTDYAEEKRDYTTRKIIERPADATPHQITYETIIAPLPRIQTQNTDLSWPEEIAQIERGYYKYWAGAFINDGNSSWEAIDLDRRITINVIRRIYVKGGYNRSFGDPVFMQWDSTSFARKFSDENRTEIEVVTRRLLNDNEIEAFVCAANGEWKMDKQTSFEQIPPMPSDTMANVVHLLDRQTQDGVTYIYDRKTSSNNTLDLLMQRVLFTPRIEWK